MISASDILGGAALAEILGDDMPPPLSPEEELRRLDELEAEREGERLARARRRRRAELEISGVDVGHAALISGGGVIVEDYDEARERIRARKPRKFDHVSFYLGNARRALAEGCTLVVLSGAKGRGKSLIQNLLISELGGRVIEARNLGPEGLWLKDGARSGITGCTKQDLLTGARALAVDDYGQEAAALRDATTEAMNDLIPSRCSRRLITIASTNLITDREAARLKRLSPGDADAIDATRLTAWMGPRWGLFEARVREHGRIITVWGRDLRPEMEE